ncbi:S1 family peptidase [Actinomycetospora sp. CA-101289]|uniref:S1 family peptidase n=1 Tax=Actinomycetospora sp. CA-101289 TaxID=3239893 RepID=UPI003D954A66
MPDPRVPGYLGRVLDQNDEPIGTCFQVADRIVATAWHVIADVGAGTVGSDVNVDALNDVPPSLERSRSEERDRQAIPAVVLATDPEHDLALLRLGVALPRIAPSLQPSDGMELAAQISVTGVAAVEDYFQYRFLDALGNWAGGTTRSDSLQLARITSDAVMRGMSGAPVLTSTGSIAGVVSGRYNSQDGWLRDTAWVARTEDLERILIEYADVRVSRREPSEVRGPSNSRSSSRPIAIQDLWFEWLHAAPRSDYLCADISVHNGGSHAALISRVIINCPKSCRFRPIAPPAAANFPTAGFLESSSRTFASLPGPSEEPFLVQRKMSQLIEPNAFDRFELVVEVPRPEGKWTANIYHLEFEFLYNGGGRAVSNGVTIYFPAPPRCPDVESIDTSIKRFVSSVAAIRGEFDRVGVSMGLDPIPWRTLETNAAQAGKVHSTLGRRDIVGKTDVGKSNGTITEAFWRPRYAVAKFIAEHAAQLASLEEILGRDGEVASPDRDTPRPRLESISRVLAFLQQKESKLDEYLRPLA